MFAFGKIAKKCFFVLAAACLSALALTAPGFAHAEQSYSIFWDDLNTENGVIHVYNKEGNELAPNNTVIPGETINVSFEPASDEFTKSATISISSNDSSAEAETRDLEISSNKASFVMPEGNVVINAEFVNERNTIGYNLASHGKTVITNQAGEVVGEAKHGEILTVTFTPATGYILKEAMLLEFSGGQETPLEVNNGKASFVMPAAEAAVQAIFVRIDGKYEISTYAYALGGKVVPEDKKGKETYFFAPGSKVYLNCTANEGFKIDQVYLMGIASGDEYVATKGSDGRYSFTMPEEDIAANAGFALKNGGINIWLNETVVGSAGPGGLGGDGSRYGDVSLVNSSGKTIYGQKPGETVEVRIKPDNNHTVHSVVYSYSNDEGSFEEIITPADGKHIFTMPDCYDATVYVYYQRVNDGLIDVTYRSQEVKPENMNVKITDARGNELSAARPGDTVIFEYLPGSDFVLNYVLNYMEDPEGTSEKLGPTKYSFVMPDYPLGIEVGLSRVEVDVHSDDTVYIPESGEDSAQDVALGIFWDLIAGNTPDGMTEAEAQTFRDMLNNPAYSGAYLDVIIKANKTNISQSQEGLILDIIKNDEFIVFSFDLSVIFGISTDGGLSTEANLSELDEGIHFQLMPQNVEDGFVRVVRIHDGVAEMVPVEDVNAEGIVIEADRFSTYTVVVSDTTTVAFDSNGGSAVESQEVGYAQKLVKPADPTREGYTFAGWYLDEELTTAYNFEKPVTMHLGTLYAKWIPDGAEDVAGHIDSNESALADTGDNTLSIAIVAALGCVLSAVTLFIARQKKA